MKKEKIVSALLVLSLLAAAVTGCSGNGDSTQSSGPSVAGASGEEKKDQTSGEKVKYVIMFNQSIAEYPPDGGEAKQAILKKLETDLGITNMDYEVVMVGGDDYETKLNAMLAGGDVPDMFESKIQNLDTLVTNAIIAPVDDFIPKMPVYQATLEADIIGKSTHENFSIDGKHYGFSNGMDMLNYPPSGNTDGMIIRTDWLENLGLTMPKTLDELHDVLYAFTFNDPDGNGANDTYGLGGSTETNKMFPSIFGAYGIFMRDINSWVERDGKLVHATTLPETKEALTLLQQWYKEGIIDPDKFILESTQTKEKFASGKIGAYENSLWWANDARVTWQGAGTKASCAMMPPVTGPSGSRGFPVSHIKNSAKVISRNCAENKDVDTLLKVLNWMLDDGENGGLRLVMYGEEGKHYTYNTEKDFIDQSLIADYADLYRAGYSNPMRWLAVEDPRWMASDDPRALDMKVTNEQEAWLYSKFLGSVPAMMDYPDLYNKLWAEYCTKIITGELSIDAFDDYVTKFDQQGGKELTGQVNEAIA